MAIPLSFEQKRDLVLKAVVDLNRKFNEDFVIQEEFLSFEKDDNAWLLILSNVEESKLYFSVFEWEIKGDFIKRVLKKEDPFLVSITEIPCNIIKSYIYDEGAVVFKLNNHEYIVFNFAGKQVLKTQIYPQVQEHLNFLNEISTLHDCGIC